MAKPMTYCLLACVWIGVMVANDLEVAPVCAGPEDESCGKHGTCTDEYKCVCTDGYTGEMCESCIEESAGVVCGKDYCEVCHKRNTALCVESRTMYCQCLPGHQPMYNGVCLPGCTKGSCTEPNHHCSSTTFKCECKEGYEMIDGACEKKCPGGCGAHGRCDDGECWCTDGYIGINCEDKISCAERCLHGMCEQENCTYCEDGYRGNWCEVEPVCTGPDDDRSCGEHATCTYEYKCECADGYIGENCTVECNGHGTVDGWFHDCNCADGYTGYTCEIAPVCAGPDDESCGEHGTCTDEYTCECTDGYTGETCEVQCNGHGELDWNVVCNCADGYTGETCEVAPVCTPYDDWSCGRHGTCNDEYVCICTDGYSGENCTVVSGAMSGGDDSKYHAEACYIVVGCLGSVIIIALIAVFLWKDCRNGIAYKRFTGSDTSKQDAKSSTSDDVPPQEVALPAEDSTVNVDIERQE